MTTRTHDSDDIFVWADGSWLFRGEHEDAASSSSDDFYVLFVDTPEYAEFLTQEGY